MDQLDVTLKTANGNRKADIQVAADVTVGELLDSARQQWALPGNYEYILRSEHLGRELRPSDSLGAIGIVTGDRLEILQISDAGAV
ncbi:MAG: EsaB/YukD family protein [Thermomicrobiales bacterium]